MVYSLLVCFQIFNSLHLRHFAKLTYFFKVMLVFVNFQSYREFLAGWLGSISLSGDALYPSYSTQNLCKHEDTLISFIDYMQYMLGLRKGNAIIQ